MLYINKHIFHKNVNLDYSSAPFFGDHLVTYSFSALNHTPLAGPRMKFVLEYLTGICVLSHTLNRNLLNRLANPTRA